MVKNDGVGYKVFTDCGKPLTKIYEQKEDAVKKSQQIEYFKHRLNELVHHMVDESLVEVHDINEAEYKGKNVTLNKPFRTPKGPKKFAVYVKNDKGNIQIVRFGDPNMEIKRDDPERRKAYRARHKGDNIKDKTKAGYWSWKFWGTKSVSELLSENILW